MNKNRHFILVRCTDTWCIQILHHWSPGPGLFRRNITLCTSALLSLTRKKHLPSFLTFGRGRDIYNKHRAPRSRRLYVYTRVTIVRDSHNMKVCYCTIVYKMYSVDLKKTTKTKNKTKN